MPVVPHPYQSVEALHASGPRPTIGSVLVLQRQASIYDILAVAATSRRQPWLPVVIQAEAHSREGQIATMLLPRAVFTGDGVTAADVLRTVRQRPWNAGVLAGYLLERCVNRRVARLLSATLAPQPWEALALGRTTYYQHLKANQLPRSTTRWALCVSIARFAGHELSTEHLALRLGRDPRTVRAVRRTVLGSTAT